MKLSKKCTANASPTRRAASQCPGNRQQRYANVLLATGQKIWDCRRSKMIEESQTQGRRWSALQ
jgi:hypothetical protein